MWENLNIALKSLNGIILLIIYLRSTTGLTDTIINELSGSFIESGLNKDVSRSVKIVSLSLVIGVLFIVVSLIMLLPGSSEIVSQLLQPN